MRFFRPVAVLLALLALSPPPVEAASRVSGCVSVAVDLLETATTQAGQSSRHVAGQYQQPEIRQCFAGDPTKLAKVVTVDLTLSASGTQNVDLAGSISARLAANSTMTFTTVRGWCLMEYEDTGSLSIAPGASNPFAAGLTGTTPAIATRGYGGLICSSIGPALTGDTVTAGTGDIILISCSSAGACTGRLVVWGT